MKHLLYTLLLGVFLTSCYRKIDLDEYRTTPKIVINSVVSPDTVVMASITRTWFYPDKKPYVNLPHAHVELYINNQYIETMQWKTLNNPPEPRPAGYLIPFKYNPGRRRPDKNCCIHPRIWYGNGRRYHTKESTYKKRQSYN